MGSRDVSQLNFQGISDLCRKYSQGQVRYSKGSKDTLYKVTKLETSVVNRDKQRNLLENFKNDILGTLSLQLDTLQLKNKKEEENATLSIFFQMQKETLTQRMSF